MNYKVNRWHLRERSGLVLRRPILLLFLALCFAAILIFLSGAYLQKNERARHMVNLNTEPQISLKVNAKGVVIDTIAYDKKGQAVLDELDLYRADLNVAVHSVVTALIRKGYVDVRVNELPLSVTGQSFVESQHLRFRLRALIELLLEEYSS